MCVIFFKIRTISSQGRKLKKHGNRFTKHVEPSGEHMFARLLRAGFAAVAPVTPTPSQTHAGSA